MKFDDDATLYRVQRCMDGFFAWMLFILILLISRQAFRTDGSLSFVAIIPIFGMAWSAVSIPDVSNADEWSLVRSRLRISALVWAGCAPLVVYWSRLPDNFYLFANFGICVLGGAMVLLQTARLLKLSCQACGADTLAKESTLTYHLIFWVTLVGTCGGGFGVALLGVYVNGATPLQFIRGIASIGVDSLDPRTLRMVMVGFMMVLFSPLIFFVSVTFRTRLVMHFYLLKRLKRREET